MAIAAPHVVVAIPVCNEVERIEACLQALDRQTGAQAGKVVLLLNNCDDGTAACVRRIEPALAIECEIIERELEGEQASAGYARSLALRYAAIGLVDHDLLVTTDADGEVAENWIAANLAAFACGADAVCGRAEIDPVEARLISAHLHEDDARECRLGALNDEIAALLDPDPHDPWPRHTEHSGASIAVTVSAWRRAGGMPAMPSGEDRAFIDRLRGIDARVRHCPAVRVTVSGRTFGRAAGGMADTIRRRMVRQDDFVDDAIEPAADRYRRALLRAQARAIWARANRAGDDDLALLAEALERPEAAIRDALTLPFFGQVWAALERGCPTLARKPVRFVDLATEIETALALRAQACRKLVRQPRLAVAVPA